MVILTARCVTKEVLPCSLGLTFPGVSSSSLLGSNHPKAAPTTSTAPSIISARNPPMAAFVVCDITIAIFTNTYLLNNIINLNSKTF